MTFDELLNCLSETSNTIKSMHSELNTVRNDLSNSQNTVTVLQSDSVVKDNRIAQLNRQVIAQRVIGVALCFDMQDIQYKFGGEWENDKAFDCSGFMQVCFRVGSQGLIKLPRTSHQQSLVGTPVLFDQIEPGDTLHYDFDGDGTVTHVGLAMGNGLMIHTNSPETDINIVKIADFNKGKGLVAVRRHI